MTGKRTSASLAIATALAGVAALSATLATPIAHADPLDPIISTVKNDRSKTRCPQLNYSGVLEGAAQTYAITEKPVHGQPANYNGKTLAFLGSGDPQAAATTSAYQRGAGGLISNCDFTEFGVGFIRHEDREVDVVTIVFGAPAAPPAAPPAENKPAEIPPPPQVAPVAPKDAIQVDINRAGFNVNVNVTNTADLAGKCTYAANPVGNPLLPAVNKNFNIGAKGSTQLSFLAPPPLSTYHVVVSCNGTFNGQNVEFGHVEQDVSG